MPTAWVMWFVIGAFIGSFLNVCAYRLPREQSIVRPRSRCPSCEHPIVWYENIPLFSYVGLRGRCRHCRGVIHWRYPVVELISGLAAVAVLTRFGVTPRGIAYLCFVWALIVASAVDFEFQIIPDEISLGGLAVGLVVSSFVPALHGANHVLVGLQRSIVGALVGGGVLYLTGTLGNLGLVGLRRLGVRLRRHPVWRARLAKYRHVKECMGGGDVKLLAMAGSVLGWKLAVLTFFLAPVIAIVPGIAVLVFKRSHVIPYGPFLSAALIVSLFFGERMLQLSGIEETMRLLWSYRGWAN